MDLWSSRGLLSKFVAVVLAMCLTSDLTGEFSVVQEADMTSGGIEGFCLVFRELAWSL